MFPFRAARPFLGVCSLLLCSFLFPQAPLPSAPPQAIPHPAPLRPDSSLEAPPLPDLIAEFLRLSPDLDAANQRIRALEGLVRPASALPDPMVGVSFRDMGLKILPDRDQTLMFEVQQNLLFPGKRLLRERQALADVEIGKGEYQQLLRQLILRIRETYAALFARDHAIQILDDTHQLLKAMEDNLASRYASGQINLEALLKVQYAISSHDLERTHVVGQRNSLLPQLNRLLSRPADQPLGQVRNLPEIAVESSAQQLGQLAVERSPEVALALARVIQAQRQLELAQLELKPNFIAGAGLGSEEGRATLELKFAVELPFWQAQKQRPLIGVAESRLSEARTQLRIAQDQARSRAASLHADWERANHRLHLISEALLPQARATFEAAQQTFRTGQNDFSTLIEDFNLLLSANLEAFNARAECFSIWAQIQELEGK